MDAGPAFAGSRGALQQQTQTKSNEKRSNPFNQTKKNKKNTGHFVRRYRPV
jgi:hypothetical protein